MVAWFKFAVEPTAAAKGGNGGKAPLLKEKAPALPPAAEARASGGIGCKGGLGGGVPISISPVLQPLAGARANRMRCIAVCVLGALRGRKNGLACDNEATFLNLRTVKGKSTRISRFALHLFHKGFAGVRGSFCKSSPALVLPPVADCYRRQKGEAAERVHALHGKAGDTARQGAEESKPAS